LGRDEGKPPKGGTREGGVIEGDVEMLWVGLGAGKLFRRWGGDGGGLGKYATIDRGVKGKGIKILTAS